MDGKAGLRRSFELRRERAVEVLDGGPRMAVGIAGDADLDDAVGLQQAALDHLDRGMEWARRRRAIAGDDEEAAHAGCREPREMGIERAGAREAAHRKMRDRLEPGRGERRDDIELLLHRPREHGAHIDARALGKRAQRVEIAGGEARHLEGGLAGEVGDAR